MNYDQEIEKTYHPENFEELPKEDQTDLKIEYEDIEETVITVNKDEN